jgi:serine/threonine-protein kinase
MAEVYKARDTVDNRLVALKVLRDDLAEDRIFLRRFRREALVLEQLRHSNIMAYHGFEGSGDLAFIVVEYVDGETLRRKLRRLRKPLATGQALSVLKPVCDALQYAHGLGIYHCDIKPANIVIAHDGRIVVTDFGIARMTGIATATSMMPGTPAYMAPEQCRGLEIDARTDVYALGIVLFELLTLERPFKGDTATIRGSTNERIRWEQLRRPAPSPNMLNPEVPLSVARQIRTALSKKPSSRHRSAMEFYQSLVIRGLISVDSNWHWEDLQHQGAAEDEGPETPST